MYIDKYYPEFINRWMQAKQKKNIFFTDVEIKINLE
jgi:hypothetical protein